eukprot:TRINITY_DN7757_c0_g1_i1.p1 TRINITY_DN7757_c0_g1~~TRINITY_DN7757_c0_g1_i1.p1  ORF type:complete len:213 (-),score=57.52 TRINITY_DN7757_c0_g1_i1:182-820(-)
MLKLKRTYDDMAFGSSPSPACSPHKITFLDNNNDGSPFKRARTSNYNPNQGFLSTSPRESNFPSTNWNIDNVDEKKWIEWLPANSRRKLLHYVQNNLQKTQQEEKVNAENNPFQPHLLNPQIQPTKPAQPNPFNQPLNTNFDKPISKTDRIFSIEDVKQIIQSAIEERESEIRKEYDRILEETLQDQFTKFSQFSQDYIDRQLKDSTYNYMI